MPPASRYVLWTMRTPARFSGRAMARIGTACRSNGLAIAVADAIGSSGCAAVVNIVKMPPRLHPAMCTAPPPAWALTASTASGRIESVQCSMPWSRWLNFTGP